MLNVSPIVKSFALEEAAANNGGGAWSIIFDGSGLRSRHRRAVVLHDASPVQEEKKGRKDEKKLFRSAMTLLPSAVLWEK